MTGGRLLRRMSKEKARLYIPVSTDDPEDISQGTRRVEVGMLHRSPLDGFWRREPSAMNVVAFEPKGDHMSDFRGAGGDPFEM
mmetsp:Transcript_85155/g.237678  ORF Transcript_85155/g.237678 Transcript_85155/m.237678 type:complete len:83 (+) Transcript_85155:40-288(+)